MASPFRRPRGPGRSERGVAAVETAFSLTILAFLAAAAVHLTDAMFTKQRMLSATTSATRTCMVVRENQGQCARDRVEAALVGIRDRCETLAVQAVRVPGPADFPLLKVDVTCLYIGAGGLGRAATGLMENTRLTLKAQTTVPLARPR